MFLEKDLDKMFKNALVGKMGFLDNKHVILTQWENVHFSKGVLKPMIFVKDLKFRLILISFEKKALV